MDESKTIVISDDHMKKFSKRFYFYFKSFMDFIFALIAIIITLPILLIISIAIKLDSRGPVIFKQERTGYKGKIFYLYKFRSMAKDNDVHDFSSSDKQTRVGSFLRKTSLDELPQFFNVLLFQMAIIGPRPWIVDYWNNMNENQRHRCDVRPGITGLAQAKGRNNISIHEKINYDLEYIRDYSLFEDIKVVLLTVKTVLSKEGAEAGKNVIKTEIDDLVDYNTRYDMKPINVKQ